MTKYDMERRIRFLEQKVENLETQVVQLSVQRVSTTEEKTENVSLAPEHEEARNAVLVTEKVNPKTEVMQVLTSKESHAPQFDKALTTPSAVVPELVKRETYNALPVADKLLDTEKAIPHQLVKKTLSQISARVDSSQHLPSCEKKNRLLNRKRKVHCPKMRCTRMLLARHLLKKNDPHRQNPIR